MGSELTKAQRSMLVECAVRHGLTMMDGIEAGVASRLHAKGLVTLPAGHGAYFGSHWLKVKITDLGRAAIAKEGKSDD